MSGNWVLPLAKTRTVPELGVALRLTTANSLAGRAGMAPPPTPANAEPTTSALFDAGSPPSTFTIKLSMETLALGITWKVSSPSNPSAVTVSMPVSRVTVFSGVVS